MNFFKPLLKFFFVVAVICLDIFAVIGIMFIWILAFFTITPIFTIISMIFLFFELNRYTIKITSKKYKNYNVPIGWIRKSWLAIGFCSLLVVIVLNGRWIYQELITIYNENEYELYNKYKPFQEGKIISPSNILHFRENNPPVIDGAKALYPIYANFAEKIYDKKIIGNTDCYYKNNGWRRNDSQAVIIDCRNTREAFKSLLNGENDIIFLAQPSEEQMQEAKERGLKLSLKPIGKEAFVFFVNKSNPVNNLSVQEIKDIYSGKIRFWGKVGGKWWQNIRAFQRVNNSGSQATMEKFMADTPLMKPIKYNTIDGMGGIISKVAEYRNHYNSIGYSFLFFVETMNPNKKIKILSIDGIYPNRENIRNGSYPLTYPFYAIRVEGRENKKILAFWYWLDTAEAKEIIEKSGYTAYEN